MFNGKQRLVRPPTGESSVFLICECFTVLKLKEVFWGSDSWLKKKQQHDKHILKYMVRLSAIIYKVTQGFVI